MSDYARVQGLDQLADELRDRGLKVTVKVPALTSANSAATNWDGLSDPVSPRLCQSVQLRNSEDSGLTWYWEFAALPPAVRDVSMPPPDVEPMNEAKDIIGAADRVEKVVRLKGETTGRGACDV